MLRKMPSESSVVIKGERIVLPRCLYFAQSLDRKILKVGIAVNPVIRVKALQIQSCILFANVSPLRMVGCSIGTHADETALLRLMHLWFRPFIGQREWFHWSDGAFRFLSSGLTATVGVAMAEVDRRRLAIERRADGPSSRLTVRPVMQSQPKNQPRMLATHIREVVHA